MGFDRTSLIIAIDDSGGAARALDFGLELAETLRLPVRLVHVVSSSVSPAADVRRPALPAATIQAGFPEQEIGAALLDESLARAGSRRVDIEPVLLGGDPRDALLRYLDECDRPILVVGRRGQGRLREWLLGSVSDHLLRHASCPVMVVS